MGISELSSNFLVHSRVYTDIQDIYKIRSLVWKAFCELPVFQTYYFFLCMIMIHVHCKKKKNINKSKYKYIYRYCVCVYICIYDVCMKIQNHTSNIKKVLKQKC